MNIENKIENNLVMEQILKLEAEKSQLMSQLSSIKLNAFIGALPDPDFNRQMGMIVSFLSRMKEIDAKVGNLKINMKIDK